jgi:hypothetical protein
VNRSMFVGVPMRECIGDCVGGTQLILHPEIKAEKLAYPLMLRDHREPLVQQELQADMIRVHEEWMPPQVWVSVAHGLNQAHELAFIGCQIGMSRSHLSTKERDDALSLM